MVRTYTSNISPGMVSPLRQFSHTFSVLVLIKYQNLSNNEEEVREEWEKIQFAYSILIDNKTRKRYDRSETIADPGAAMRRPAVEATMMGVTSIGKGLFSLGLLAVETLSNSNNTNKGKDENDEQ